MKLFAFEGAETDWVAANSEAEARDTLKHHYGIGDDDIDGSYESISEVNADEVEFYTDETDAETEETKTLTATDMMAGKAHPFVVGSTCVPRRRRQDDRQRRAARRSNGLITRRVSRGTRYAQKPR